MKKTLMESLILYDDPLEIIEKILRDVIHDVLSLKYGPDWHLDEEIGLGSGWVENLEDKKKADTGVLKPEPAFDLPIAYAEFSDLGKLFEKHKKLFTSIFENWETFQAYYSTAEKLRNIVKHHRDLSPTQYHLLDGIAGEIESDVNYWRIGIKLDIKKTSFMFRDYVPTEGKLKNQILTESSKYIADWKERIAHVVKCSDFEPSNFNIKENKFEYALKGQHISMRIYTHANPRPKQGIHGRLEVSSGCRANLNDLLKCIGKSYFHISYDLAGNIDVEALRKWSLERAGLNPSGSIAQNGELTSVEYGFLGGKIRIGASKYAGSRSSMSGRLSASTDTRGGFWRAHSFLDSRRLIGFMVGSITPKAMMYLVRASQIP